MSKAGCQGAAHTMGKVCPKAANLRGQVLCWAEKHCKHQEVKLLGVSAVKLTPSDKVGRVNQHEMAAVYAQLSSKWQEESKNRLPGFLSQKPLRGYCNLPVLTKSPCPNKSQCKPMKLGYWLILRLDVVHLHPYALAPHQFGPAFPALTKDWHTTKHLGTLAWSNFLQPDKVQMCPSSRRRGTFDGRFWTNHSWSFMWTKSTKLPQMCRELAQLYGRTSKPVSIPATCQPVQLQTQTWESKKAVKQQKGGPMWMGQPLV